MNKRTKKEEKKGKTKSKIAEKPLNHSPLGKNPGATEKKRTASSNNNNSSHKREKEGDKDRAPGKWKQAIQSSKQHRKKKHTHIQSSRIMILSHF